MEVRCVANFLKDNAASGLSVGVSVCGMKIVPEYLEKRIWRSVRANRNGETEIMSTRLFEYSGKQQSGNIVSSID